MDSCIKRTRKKRGKKEIELERNEERKKEIERKEREEGENHEISLSFEDTIFHQILDKEGKGGEEEKLF